MKEVEPQLDAATHAKVTQLLCELTAYDLMQVLHSMERRGPRRCFRDSEGSPCHATARVARPEERRA